MKPAIHPVVLADLGNYRICGARDSKNFLQAVRGQREGEICSEENHIPCNRNVDPQNIICVPIDEPSKCPITDLVLFKTLAELHDFIFENQEGDYLVADDPWIQDRDEVRLSELTPL
jgi:hypothetical protein